MHVSVLVSHQLTFTLFARSLPSCVQNCRLIHGAHKQNTKSSNNNNNNTATRDIKKSIPPRSYGFNYYIHTEIIKKRYNTNASQEIDREQERRGRKKRSECFFDSISSARVERMSNSDKCRTLNYVWLTVIQIHQSYIYTNRFFFRPFESKFSPFVVWF